MLFCGNRWFGYFELWIAERLFIYSRGSKKLINYLWLYRYCKLVVGAVANHFLLASLGVAVVSRRPENSKDDLLTFLSFGVANL
ncbi:hypothetical protein C4K03_2439 [Pseudomonas synxantha]|uniref:Uncharacterized protein n=1 Tax=Pseudomonas synxantha TaxID=47883 RepID=A0A3G7U5D1_9PSED|nr:hypothetical protein C4K03_2439 [Pseudomonas synxantha]